MTDESEVSVGPNGQEAPAPLLPKRRARKVQTSPSAPTLKAMARKAAKNKPNKAIVKATGKAKAKPVKAVAKRKARTVDPAKQDQFGLRKGSIKSRAAAMYASKRGATLNAVKEAVGSVQFNLLNELEGKGFKVLRELVPGAGSRQATRYRVIAK